MQIDRNDFLKFFIAGSAGGIVGTVTTKLADNYELALTNDGLANLLVSSVIYSVIAAAAIAIVVLIAVVISKKTGLVN